MNISTARPAKQEGFVTIALVASVLVATSLGLGYSMKSTKSMITMNNSSKGSTEAFEAAQAGLEYGINYINHHRQSMTVDADNNGMIDHAPVNGTIAGRNYHFRYENLQPGKFDKIKVIAKGFSADGQKAREVSQVLFFDNLLKTNEIPKVTVTSRTCFELYDKASVVNSDYPIGGWAGNYAEIGRKAGLYTSISNNRRVRQSDYLKDGDYKIGRASEDALFSNYFGMNKNAVKQHAAVKKLTERDSLSGIKGEAIWVTPSRGTLVLRDNQQIGTADQPVILIVDGQLELRDNTKIYGFVLTTNRFYGKDNGKIHGSVVTSRRYRAQDNFTSFYDQNVLNNIQIGAYTKVPGGWKDF